MWIYLHSRCPRDCANRRRSDIPARVLQFAGRHGWATSPVASSSWGSARGASDRLHVAISQHSSAFIDAAEHQPVDDSGRRRSGSAAMAIWQTYENKGLSFQTIGQKKPSVETTEGDLSERRLPKIAPCDHRGQLARVAEIPIVVARIPQLSSFCYRSVDKLSMRRARPIFAAIRAINPCVSPGCGSARSSRRRTTA